MIALMMTDRKACLYLLLQAKKILMLRTRTSWEVTGRGPLDCQDAGRLQSSAMVTQFSVGPPVLQKIGLDQLLALVRARWALSPRAGGRAAVPLVLGVGGDSTL